MRFRLPATLRRLEAAYRAGPSWLAVRKSSSAFTPGVLPLIWIYGWMDRVLTPQGRIFCAVYLGIAFYSTILTRSPAVILFFILSGVLLVDLLVGLVFFPILRIGRHVPERVACNTEFQIRYEVFNRSILPCFDLTADASMLFRPLLATDPATPRMTLAPKENGWLIRRFRLTRRGVYRLPRTTVESAFPFQILKISRLGGGGDRIICHPAWLELRSLKLPDGSAARAESLKTVSSEGDSMDFFGCREYRTGDDPRKIHWAASAGRSQLVVKEFQEEKLSRAALILDNFPPEEPERLLRRLRDFLLLRSGRKTDAADAFEAAVSLTASIVAALSKRNFAVEFFAAGSELHHFRTGRGGMTQDSFFDLLSALEPGKTRRRFRKITPDDLDQIASTGAVFLILLSADEEAEKLYRSMIDAGAAVRVFLLAETPGPHWTERIGIHDVLAGKAGDL